jgi:hypothetical protein
MHNVLILGTGRSGSSMLAGCFRATGANFGEHQLAPNEVNPLGFYESFRVNALNNRLIHAILNPSRVLRLFSPLRIPAHREWRLYWLAAPNRIPRVTPSADTEGKMIGLLQQQPFCFKDPRFSLTLPVWERYLPAGTRFVVVFRDPGRTADSILKALETEYYREAAKPTRDWCLTLYRRTYARLLAWSAGRPEWFFVDSDEFMRDERVCRALEQFVGAELDLGQIDPSIRKSRPGEVESSRHGRQAQAVYEQVRARARQDCAQVPV